MLHRRIKRIGMQPVASKPASAIMSMPATVGESGRSAKNTKPQKAERVAPAAATKPTNARGRRAADSVERLFVAENHQRPCDER